ncbi:MAG: energy-coupling factor ABC transporter permease [Candidatus Wallbacteria bacterium]|nr:energy-coupling factor ABC transporter permease [Candidatus Wallbacteria bacterium]
MHIPDGFLDVKTAAAAYAIAILGIGYAARKFRNHPSRHVPAIAMAAAFIFSAQMLNFPVAGGTSGHLGGGCLAALLFGPEAALLIMSVILILQCLLFADGGITALGANIFNMGIVAPFLGYAVYHLMRKISPMSLRADLFAAGVAAWCATVASAISCACQLACSDTIAWKIALPSMAGVHMLIGLCEGLITVFVMKALARPALRVPAIDATPYNLRRLVMFGLLISAGLAVFVAPWACPWPDGLEKVAENHGFISNSVSNPFFTSPFADYTLSCLKTPGVSIAAAGFIGILTAFACSYFLAVFVSSGTEKNQKKSHP